jgi:DNA-directed RNA polymerase
MTELEVPPGINATRFKAQVEMERKERHGLIQRLRKRTRELEAAGVGSVAPRYSSFLKQVVLPLSERIQEVGDRDRRGVPGHLSTSALLVGRLDPEVVSLVACKAVIDAICGPKTNNIVVYVAKEIGKRLDREMKYTKMSSDRPKLYEYMRHVTNMTTGQGRPARRAQLLRMANLEWSPWPLDDRVRVGVWVLHRMADIGLLELRDVRKHARKTEKRVLLSAHVVEHLEDRDDFLEYLIACREPMIVKPRPWSRLSGGGYYTEEGKPLKFTLNRLHPGHFDDLKSGDMTAVFEAVNRLQETSWEVNETVYRTIQWAVDHEIDIGDLPPTPNIPMPPFPGRENKQEFLDWKAAAYKVHREREARLSKRVSAMASLNCARRFIGHGYFYYPYRVDFRGRIYAVPHALQPQGPGFMRAMVRFHEAKPIETAEQARWLKIHAANCYGLDKTPMNERVEWADTHADLIVEAARDPRSTKWWRDADDPWMFLAAADELTGFLEQGYGFLSRLPINVDGTCNGLQHFSAMLRDNEGGAEVNLVPGDRPADIYARVAERLSQKLEDYTPTERERKAKERRLIEKRTKIATDGGNKADKVGIVLTAEGDAHEAMRKRKEYAQQWLRIGVNRSLVKRPVMVLPYGGTSRAFYEYVHEKYREMVAGGMPDYFGEELSEAVQLLVTLLWDAAVETVKAAMDAMAFLRECASKAARAGVPIRWTSPVGFPVCQQYCKAQTRKVECKDESASIVISVAQAADAVDSRKQRNSLPPNFVHSYDAAHLVYSVNQAHAEGIDSFLVVHDSYGTHAADMPRFTQIIREQFVSLYENHCPLESLRNRLVEEGVEDLPPVPPRGDMDLSLVLDSEYFFS